MSMQEVREQNIALVTQTALACFVENGIEKTTIRDIAHRAGLTERSVYRYFAGKDELVIAAAYLYWDRAKELAAQSLAKQRRRGMTGIEEIRVLLRSYAGLIFTDPAGIRFSLDAEVALCNAGRQHAVINRPPERFEVAPGPIAAAIRRGRVGISPKHKPVSFIFVGPTGVGKTELVKQLAADLFDSPDSLIRLDMSEFMEKHSVSRLVGSPPGYVGYDEAGQLTEKIRRKPYAVILFDEIEKAHPDVLNVLLQILDDGEVTDAHGRKVNFENTVIVMTSNAGSDRKEGSVGFGRSVSEQNRERIMKALGEFLRPEFINRVDEIICFNRLDEKNFVAIARIMLDELAASLKEKGFTFTYDDAVAAYLANKSYSLTYGARNLRRTIQKELEDVIATRIIDSYDHPVTQLRAVMKDGAIDLLSL